MIRLLLCFCMVVSGVGCAASHEVVPTASIPFAEADYELGDSTSAEVCSAYILMIAWGKIFGRDTAFHSVPSAGPSIPFVGGLMVFGGASPEAEEAMYVALEKMPGATHLLAPRVKTTFVGVGTTTVPLFGERCGRVEAKSVTIGPPRYDRGGKGSATAIEPRRAQQEEKRRARQEEKHAVETEEEPEAAKQKRKTKPRLEGAPEKDSDRSRLEDGDILQP